MHPFGAWRDEGKLAPGEWRIKLPPWMLTSAVRRFSHSRISNPSSSAATSSRSKQSSKIRNKMSALMMYQKMFLWSRLESCTSARNISSHTLRYVPLLKVSMLCLTTVLTAAIRGWHFHRLRGSRRLRLLNPAARHKPLLESALGESAMCWSGHRQEAQGE